MEKNFHQKNSFPNLHWSDTQKKWICYHDIVIDQILLSKEFTVPDYDLSRLETRLKTKFTHTSGVISQLPLAHEGYTHNYLRKKMTGDINKNTSIGIKVFEEELSTHFFNLENNSEFDLGALIIKSILKSNLTLADLHYEDAIDYSDFTLLLDDMQSIKSRLEREKNIGTFYSNLNHDDGFYKIALITVGVNALISTTLNSLIKVLSNDNRCENLTLNKFFTMSGIKSLERVCLKDTIINTHQFNKGDAVKLMMSSYDSSDLSALEKNKRFFISDSSHGCPGMAFSLHIWKSLLGIISQSFTKLEILDVKYRKNDSIFLFPHSLIVKTN